MGDREYRLRCCSCGVTYEDDGVRLSCDAVHAPALLRTEYGSTFEPGVEPSIARYSGWLPLGKPVESAARTAVYRSNGLAAYLGLTNLWIAFNGWWPQRNATLGSATFKELEAVAVLSRLASNERRTMVVASAGNTAAAFAAIATERELPVLIVLPLEAWDALAALVHVGPSVSVVAVADATYDDAIAVAQQVAARDGYVAEGGVRNVGRRDGMGTVVLSAVEAIGTLPDVYVQAVGSGAGALAAHEAALRLIGDGRFGARVPRLLLSQNAPFTPIHDAWSKRAPQLETIDPADARARQLQIAATVLANPAPPYALAGGVREALEASGGSTYAVSNDEMFAAMRLFAEREGIDIEPAPGVAVASLARAARDGAIRSDETVLLNVTGGGRARRSRVATTQHPTLIVARGDARRAAAAVDALVRRPG